MESKNISMQWVSIREDLDKGYRELEEGRYNFATIVFDKVLGEDEGCGSAYLGKALAEMEQKNLFCVLENNLMGELYRRVFFSSDKIRSAVLSDSEIKNRLFEYGYNSAENHSAEDAKLILGFLDKHAYKDATSRVYMCESREMLEDKAKKYRENYRMKLETDVPNDKFFPAVQGAKRLIQNEEALAKDYPGIIGELRSIDHYYQEAQVTKTTVSESSGSKPVSEWMTSEAWVIAIILLLVCWPAAAIYFIYRYNKYGGEAKPATVQTTVADTERMEYLEDKFYRTQKKYNALCEELRFTLETMLGEEIDTFESEATSLRFMSGKGKEILEKYSRI
jgi:hypothetical protein